jgi:predicted acyltransferase
LAKRRNKLNILRQRWVATFNIIGLALAALYLLSGLMFGPKLAFRTEDKQYLLEKIEAAPTGKEASTIARPFLSIMINVISSANGALLVSCGVVLLNGCIFLINLMAARKVSSPQSRN